MTKVQRELRHVSTDVDDDCRACHAAIRAHYKLVTLEVRLLKTHITNHVDHVPLELWTAFRGHMRTIEDLGTLVWSLP